MSLIQNEIEEYKVVMIAESFAIIVGLLGQYSAERGAKAQLEFNDFMLWLTKANHSEIKSHVELNVEATLYIKALLNEDHKIFKEKLDKIDNAITAFASTVSGFDVLANSLNPNAALSPQAVDILEQLHKSGVSKVIEFNGNIQQYIFIGKEGALEISEPRFVVDDMQTLVEYGLLRHNYNSTGDNIYMLTRRGSSLVSGEAS